MSNADKNVHPAIKYFGDTEDASHPLILLFTREPNHENPCGFKADSFDEFHGDNTKMWDRSHKYLSKLVFGENGRNKFRTIARNAGYSPLVFTYLNPYSLENENRTKKQARAEVKLSDIHDHIQNIFDLIRTEFKDGIERLELVISAKGSANAARPLDLNESMVERKIKTSEFDTGFTKTEYFYNSHEEELIRGLKDDPGKKLIRDILERTYTDQL